MLEKKVTSDEAKIKLLSTANSNKGALIASLNKQKSALETEVKGLTDDVAAQDGRIKSQAAEIQANAKLVRDCALKNVKKSKLVADMAEKLSAMASQLKSLKDENEA